MILTKTNINNMTNLEKFREETKNWPDKNCPPSMRNGADPDIPPCQTISPEYPAAPING